MISLRRALNPHGFPSTRRSNLGTSLYMAGPTTTLSSSWFESSLASNHSKAICHLVPGMGQSTLPQALFSTWVGENLWNPTKEMQSPKRALLFHFLVGHEGLTCVLGACVERWGHEAELPTTSISSMMGLGASTFSYMGPIGFSGNSPGKKVGPLAGGLQWWLRY